jgi:hypothetical protein
MDVGRGRTSKTSKGGIHMTEFKGAIVIPQKIHEIVTSMPSYHSVFYDYFLAFPKKAEKEIVEFT